ncbi:hypothetical protein PMKS-002056 [Pichia membranifaciens]|uniref:Uncharacterized protein n=1 Tax=Pichia membranifaciens TaxID=4926 RepID=A0A1Q2YGH7_9ASCO|nr:hypothetical protein PMKS-002056 [Pichia membranifaciens]
MERADGHAAGRVEASGGAGIVDDASRGGGGFVEVAGRVWHGLVVDEHKCADMVCPQVVHLLPKEVFPDVSADELHCLERVVDQGGGGHVADRGGVAATSVASFKKSTRPGTSAKALLLSSDLDLIVDLTACATVSLRRYDRAFKLTCFEVGTEDVVVVVGAAMAGCEADDCCARLGAVSAIAVDDAGANALC